MAEHDDRAAGFRKRAAEMRAMAKHVPDPSQRDAMLKIATEWERLAADAERNGKDR